MLLLVGSGRALGTLWWLKPNTPLTVGRKGAPLLIDNDHSVSRKHATVTADAEDMSFISVLDNGSKFGVHINGRRCTAHSECKMGVGDKVTFGGQGSAFELRHSPAAFCLANMHSDMVALTDSIYANAKALGIPVVNDIERCTHVLVPKLEVTTKLVRALVFSRWIASPDYLSQLETLPATVKIDNPSVARVSEFIRNLEFLPTPHTPEVPTDSPVDLGSVKWLPDDRRQRLFRGNTFAFSDTAQCDKYRSLIATSGGICTMLPEYEEQQGFKRHSKREFEAQAKVAADCLLALCKDGNDYAHTRSKTMTIYLVLPSTLSGNDIVDIRSDAAAYVMRVAQLLNVRPISESELGLAVLFIPCDQNLIPSISSRAARDTGGANNDILASPDALDVSTPTTRYPIKSECVSQKNDQEGRRKRARISSFWEAAISSSHLGETPLKDTPDAGPHTEPNCKGDSGSTEAKFIDAQPEQEDTIARHRGRGNDFWSSTLKDNGSSDPPTCATDSGYAAEALDGTLTTIQNHESYPQAICKEQMQSNENCPQAVAATSSGIGALEHSNNNENQGRKLISAVAVQVVPLVKPKVSAAAHNATGHIGANFKQFKKTIHTYQHD
ncbi:hypothetical protein COEREDRAFT_94198 [Coemansia reversa NRRL 1564]|uniref:FHA domain-containing protein n=1 Tax=Coemansia reversa (strain ATCC 12441 / NRRL 1564) TaxID=763665 RepID=A0A2G5B5J8_COERN|nr:hypothetical protein COEREDRAFT_94198 [Coemansia reversa NRRL 1564]|eukprot:PIA13997.1 hypothetical protein COEREDRAFT_94198 [Coemansia reversa NRRL 1564]